MRAAQNLNGTNRRKFRSRPLIGLALGDTPIRAAYSYALTANGFDVRVIDDPAAAPIDASPKYPDVLLVDVSADSGYGWTFVQSFKSDCRAADIPVIAIVANADEPTRAHARRQRCAAVCARSCPPALLSSGIRAVLDFAAASPS
jgi:DNA-binding response OmpR family regulator